MIKRFYDADKVDEMIRDWQLKALSTAACESTVTDKARTCMSSWATLDLLRDKLPDTIVKIRIKD